MAHAFNDWNVVPEHSVRIYEALKAQGVPVQAYYHQGGHGGAPPLQLMNRWFTRYLHGVDNGVEKDPRAWIVRETTPAPAPAPGSEGRGRGRGGGTPPPTPYADYPNPAASRVTLHPRAGGNAVGGLTLRDEPRQGAEKLVDNVAVDGPSLARAEQLPHRLIYATTPLVEPVHISGTPRVTVRLSSSKPAANLSVWLVALPWEAGSNAGLITRGWADPQNHSSLTRGEPLVPGRMYTVSFPLQPDDQVIPAGKRIALMVFSSDRDFTLWPEPGTELTIDVDGTSLDLPVVGGAAALGRATGTPR
jgi:X-Pro dipeptidyl-peptidase